MFNLYKKSTWSISELLLHRWLEEREDLAIRVVSTDKNKSPEQFIDYGINRQPYPWHNILGSPCDLQWLKEELEGGKPDECILGCGFLCGDRYYEVWETVYAQDHWGNLATYDKISLIKGFKVLAFYDEVTSTVPQLTSSFDFNRYQLLPKQEDQIRFFEWLATNRSDIVGKIEEFDIINHSWQYRYYTTNVQDNDSVWVQLAEEFINGAKRSLDTLFNSWNASTDRPD